MITIGPPGPLRQVPSAAAVDRRRRRHNLQWDRGSRQNSLRTDSNRPPSGQAAAARGSQRRASAGSSWLRVAFAGARGYDRLARFSRRHPAWPPGRLALCAARSTTGPGSGWQRCARPAC